MKKTTILACALSMLLGGMLCSTSASARWFSMRNNTTNLTLLIDKVHGASAACKTQIIHRSANPGDKVIFNDNPTKYNGNCGFSYAVIKIMEGTTYIGSITMNVLSTDRSDVLKIDKKYTNGKVFTSFSKKGDVTYQ